ncbi:MAG TPA: hypothetical protein VF546_23045 [Pyrinomonadaceae bacterium]
MRITMLAWRACAPALLALAEFREAVRLNGTYEEARYNLGVLALDLGDRREAESQAQQLEQLNSPYAAKLRALLPR